MNASVNVCLLLHNFLYIAELFICWFIYVFHYLFDYLVNYLSDELLILFHDVLLNYLSLNFEFIAFRCCLATN